MVAIFTPIYDRVLQWAKHPKAQLYLVVMTIAEAIFFPIPPDVMLAPMVLANRAKAWMLAFITTVASVFGGFIGYVLGYWALELVMPIIEQAGYGATYAKAVDAFTQYGIWFVILAGFSPIPFKLITVAAGALAMPWLGFLAGSVVGRGARFFMVAGIIYAGGERAAEQLRGWVDRIGWAVVAAALIIAVVLLSGCTVTTPAPVVNRTAPSAPQGIAPATYVVRSGDSLYSIAFRYGLDWRDVAHWNGLPEPYTIQAGNTLRLRAPVGRQASTPQQRSESRPASALNDTQAIAPPPGVQVSPAPSRVAPTRVVSPATVKAPEASARAATRQVAGVSWRWPLNGLVARAFDPSATRRGIGINGNEGDVVVAAAAGEVVYSGRALIGYGELLIIKHSEQLLSAYGFNRRRLVEEGTRVEAGAPIAELGQNTEGQWQLHFEIRRDGNAVDPRAYLPTSN